MGRRESVIEELAVTRQHVGPGVEERARHNDDARTFHPGSARGRDSVFLPDFRDLERGYSMFLPAFRDLERGVALKSPRQENGR